MYLRSVASSFMSSRSRGVEGFNYITKFPNVVIIRGSSNFITMNAMPASSLPVRTAKQVFVSSHIMSICFNRLSNRLPRTISLCLSRQLASSLTKGKLSVRSRPCPTSCLRFSFAVKTTSDICDDERHQIWRIFEENMSEL